MCTVESECFFYAVHVVQILCDVTKTKFDPASAFAKEGEALQAELQQAVDSAEQSELVHQVRHVVWTKTLQRMFYLAKQCVFLTCLHPLHLILNDGIQNGTSLLLGREGDDECVCRALEHKEAVLLVGETGAGKTTLSQTLTFVRGQPLVTISCNMHTEAADFLGGYRPARNRNKAFSEFVASYNELARFVPRFVPSILCSIGCRSTRTSRSKERLIFLLFFTVVRHLMLEMQVAGDVCTRNIAPTSK